MTHKSRPQAVRQETQFSLGWQLHHSWEGFKWRSCPSPRTSALLMVWNEADEPQGTFPFVSEVVHDIRRDEDCVASADFLPVFTADDEAFTFQYENLVLPFVRMMWGMPAWSHLEVSHGEMLSAIFLCDQPADCGALGTAFCHFFSCDLRIMDSFESHCDTLAIRWKVEGYLRLAGHRVCHVSVLDICFIWE